MITYKEKVYFYAKPRYNAKILQRHLMAGADTAAIVAA